MVEQRPFKPLVGGSSPPAPTKNFLGIRTFQKVPLSFLPSIRTNRTNTLTEETEESRIKNGLNNFPPGGDYPPPVYLPFSPRHVSRLGVSFDT